MNKELTEVLSASEQLLNKTNAEVELDDAIALLMEWCVAAREHLVCNTVDAARRFASLTSPETIEKGAEGVLVRMGMEEHTPAGQCRGWPRALKIAESVLRSVEEGET